MTARKDGILLKPINMNKFKIKDRTFFIKDGIIYEELQTRDGLAVKILTNEQQKEIYERLNSRIGNRAV